MIELLVTISIVAALASLVLVSFTGTQKRARDSRRKSDLEQYMISLGTYSGTDGLYPVVSGTVDLTSLCPTLGVSACPDDPKAPSQRYLYQSDVTGTRFVVWAPLEDTSENWVVCSNGLVGTSASVPADGNCSIAAASAPLPTPTPTLPSTPTPPPAATPTPAPSGKTLSLDGSNDYVDIGNFNLSANAISLEAWVRPDRYGSDPRIISKSVGTSPNDQWWLLGFDNLSTTTARLRFRLKTNGTTNQLNVGSVGVGSWMHVVATYDGSRMRLYLNGGQIGSRSESGTVSTSGASVWIGGNPPSSTARPFDGLIDEVRIYDRALSSAEIQGNYNSGQGRYGGPEAGLAAGYHFDEGSGTTASDYSGNGRTGTLRNGATWADSSVALTIQKIFSQIASRIVNE